MKAPQNRNWPELFFIWKLWTGFWGAVQSHYFRWYPFRGFGPKPLWWVSPSNLAREWRYAKSRMYPHIRAFGEVDWKVLAQKEAA